MRKDRRYITYEEMANIMGVAESTMYSYTRKLRMLRTVYDRYREGEYSQAYRPSLEDFKNWKENWDYAQSIPNSERREAFIKRYNKQVRKAQKAIYRERFF